MAIPNKVKNKVGNEGIIAMGRGYLKFGNPGKAEKYAKEALEIYPTLDCFLLLLDVYKETNDEAAFKATYDEALKHINDAEERAMLNEKIENSSQKTENKCEANEETMKLTMHVGCEFPPGQRTGFYYDVDLTEKEMRELAREYLNNEDAYQNFETIQRQHKKLYDKIRRCGIDALDEKMGEDTLKTDILIAWGDDVEEIFNKNFHKEKIYVDPPLYYIQELEFSNILKSTGRHGIERVIPELKKIGFFGAPASAKKHLAFYGGLAKHSLTVYKVAKRLAKDMRDLRPNITIDDNSLKIVTLLHDVCKATRYHWNAEKSEYVSDYSDLPVGHGEKSVIMLQRMGLELHDDEIMAIQWHMGAWDLALQSKEAQKNFTAAGALSPLVPLLQAADTLAALIVEA